MERISRLPQALHKGEYLIGYFELCEFLNVTPPTARSWVKKSKVPFVKLGGRYFFEKNQVEEAILKGGQNAG